MSRSGGSLVLGKSVKKISSYLIGPSRIDPWYEYKYQNQHIVAAWTSASLSLARALLYPMVNAGGNEPAAELEEPSDAGASTTITG